MKDRGETVLAAGAFGRTRGKRVIALRTRPGILNARHRAHLTLGYRGAGLRDIHFRQHSVERGKQNRDTYASQAWSIKRW